MADGHAPQESRPPRGGHDHAPLDVDGVGPIVASPRQSAASASRPDQELDDRFQTYESNPAPWWIGLLWIAFLAFGAAYLIVNLIE